MGKSIQLKDSEGNVYPKSKPYTIVSNNYGNAYKFDDGLMICNMKYPTKKKINNAWGNIYLSPNFQLPNYPVPFKTLPSVSMSVEGTQGCWIMNEGNVRNATTQYPVNIYLVRSNQALNTETDFVINIIAIGMWK